MYASGSGKIKNNRKGGKDINTEVSCANNTEANFAQTSLVCPAPAVWVLH